MFRADTCSECVHGACTVAIVCIQENIETTLVVSLNMFWPYVHVCSCVYSSLELIVKHITVLLQTWHQSDGIRVNCICPGFVDTELFQNTLGLTDDGKQDISGIGVIRFVLIHCQGNKMDLCSIKGRAGLVAPGITHGEVGVECYHTCLQYPSFSLPYNAQTVPTTNPFLQRCCILVHRVYMNCTSP